MKIWQIAAFSITLGFALPAVAQMAAKAELRSEFEARMQERLDRFDANKDGVITRDEIAARVDASIKARADSEFAAIDTDKDGTISRAEFDAFRESQAYDRVKMIDRDGMSGWSNQVGDRIVIADALKGAMSRFDASDSNKDGRLSPEERNVARAAWRHERGHDPLG